MLVEYIWLDGHSNIRSKTRVLPENSLEIPEWNYDGSSCYQASGENSEVILKPQTIVPCPFRKGNSKLVLCDTYNPNNTPHNSNIRYKAKSLFDQKPQMEPWYGLEQEYFIIDNKTQLPLGVYDINDISQGQYYCSNGGNNAFGRKIAEEHLQMCLCAGLKISGINAEVAPGQWEFQIGPAIGIEAGDHLWLARFILNRLSEKYNCWINYDPKPYHNMNGSGCHCNYSTLQMRHGDSNGKGIDYINDAILKLERNHKLHMDSYGEGNHERMTGKHETANFSTFTSGKANRGASVRIGNDTVENQKGYFEDRRPASNSDPYLVSMLIFKTTCLE